MIRMEDVSPGALKALREAGYDPKTGEDALDAAMSYLRVAGAEGAVVFLTGRGDTQVVGN